MLQKFEKTLNDWNEEASKNKKWKNFLVAPETYVRAGTENAARKRYKRWLGEHFGSHMSLDDTLKRISDLKSQVAKEEAEVVAVKEKLLAPEIEEPEYEVIA